MEIVRSELEPDRIVMMPYPEDPETDFSQGLFSTVDDGQLFLGNPDAVREPSPSSGVRRRSLGACWAHREIA